MIRRYEIKAKSADDSDGDWLDLPEEIENLIINFSRKWCSCLSFTLYNHVAYNDTCAYFMECLSPFFLEKIDAEKEAGETKFLYKICDESIEQIKGFKFDLFIAPDLPEDISFLYNEAEHYLSSITHEGWYSLSFDPGKLTESELCLINSFFAQVEKNPEKTLSNVKHKKHLHSRDDFIIAEKIARTTLVE